jgi:hypothetical protein
LTIMVVNVPRLGPRQDEAAVAPERRVSMVWVVEEEGAGGLDHASNRTGRQGARYSPLPPSLSRSPVGCVGCGVCGKE